jgi:large conductance mechanosensitive channel
MAGSIPASNRSIPNIGRTIKVFCAILLHFRGKSAQPPGAQGFLRARGEKLMSMGSEFKEFIARGNVVDLAVGVVMGTAFGAIVTKFVDNMIMPVVGLLTGGVNLDGMKIVMQAADEAGGKAEVALGYGSVLGALVTFLIIAWVIFLMVKAINKIKAPPPAAAPAGPTSEELLAEIRDLLKK